MIERISISIKKNLQVHMWLTNIFNFSSRGSSDLQRLLHVHGAHKLMQAMHSYTYFFKWQLLDKKWVGHTSILSMLTNQFIKINLSQAREY